MNNMEIYQKVRSVPEEAKKQFNNGSFSGTDINPMWRIKMLTEMFGPCGIGWYYEVLSERAEEHNDMTMAIVDLNLYIKADGEWSKPIYGTGGNQLVKMTKQGLKASDEGYKMALTDALSVACKALGIGADVYFDKDKTKYTQYQVAEEKQPEEKQPEEKQPEDKKPEYKKPIGAPELFKAEGYNSVKSITIWCKQHGIGVSEFGNLRKALIASGIVDDIPSDKLTAQQASELFRAIANNFPDALKTA